MTIDEYKKKSGQSLKSSKKYFRNLFSRIFVSISFVLITLIICNISDSTKTFIKKNLFETDFKFSSINKFYNKYLLSFKENDETSKVNKNISLEYSESNDYHDGVKLIVSENYPVKLLNSGIVVFVGEKENYGNVIIVQQSNGLDVWYGNITNVSIKLYDYVEKSTIIGNANKTLYLVFQKNGVFQKYNEYIK